MSLLQPNSDLTTYAVESLGRLANPSAIPYLIQLLLDIDPQSELVTKVHETLEKIGTEASFATLNAWDARYG
ncbi:MAG: HEAT repeat domain-containing protein [Chloroflexota bacterium]